MVCLTNSSMAIVFNVLIYQFLQELLIDCYAMRHNHAWISGHCLTHQAHTFPAEADVPLGQVLADRITEAVLRQNRPEAFQEWVLDVAQEQEARILGDSRHHKNTDHSDWRIIDPLI